MPVDEVDDLFSVSSVSHKPGINFASYFPTEYVLLFFFYTIENNSLLSNLFVRRPIENLVSIVRSCLKNIGVGGIAGERVEQ